LFIITLFKRVWWFSLKVKNHWAYGGVKQVSNLIIGTFHVRFGKDLLTKRASDACYCPCCEWKGPTFYPYFAGGYTTLNAVCPQCDSHARHRGHVEYYKEHLHLFSKNGELIYFAPEQGILPKLLAAPSLNVKTSEYSQEKKSDYHLNIMNIDISDDSVDLVICHRVIEHVPDDKKAMKEIYRILKPGGTAIISVPISYDVEDTIDFGVANPLCDDHFFEYGKNFIKRIPQEFIVREKMFSELFNSSDWERMGLWEDSIFECEKPLET